MRNGRVSTSWCSAIALLALVGSGFAHAEKLKSRNYKKLKDTMGVVLLDANWGRSWGCGGFENAQLVSLTFEQIPLSDEPKGDFEVIELKTPSRLFVNPEYVSHGFIVQPGEYALTEILIKAARSVRDVGHLKAGKDTLVDGDTYPGGVLRVKAGEIVYVGHFDLDCLEYPMLWRYYADGWESFESYVSKYQKKFEFLRGADIQFRLFETENFGHSYELPPRK